MTFCIKDIDKIKLHKMCSEAMAYLSCSYDFGIMSIKRDVFLKSVNYFVTRNLGLFNTILANDRLAKENAFCLAIAERESLKFFSYISEEEAQLYHCAFWIAVNALMLKEHGSLKFFNKTFMEAVNNCLPLVRSNSTSKVLSEWLAFYTAGEIKDFDLIHELSSVIDVYLNITTGNDNYDFVSYVKDAISTNSFAADKAIDLIENYNPAFKLIYRPLPQRNKVESDIDVEGKLAEIELYCPIKCGKINLHSSHSNKYKSQTSTNKSNPIPQYVPDNQIKSHSISCKIDSNTNDTGDQKTGKPTASNDKSNSGLPLVKYLLCLLFIVYTIIYIFAIVKNDHDHTPTDSTTVNNFQSSQNVVTQVDEVKYLKARDCLAESIQLQAHKLKYLSFLQKDFLNVLELEYDSKCSSINHNDLEYKKALEEFDSNKRDSLKARTVSDMNNVQSLFNELYMCCHEEKSDLISVFNKLNLLGYAIPINSDIRKNTVSAIKKFQQTVGISVSGEYSSSLVAAIDAELLMRDFSLNKLDQGSKDIDYFWKLEDVLQPTYLYENKIDPHNIISAANGNLEAMFSIGNKLSSSDQKVAFKWIKLAAEKGYIAAQIKLSQLYSEGIGCSINLNKSKYWLEQATNAGNIEATLMLADLELSGIQQELNKKIAFELLSNACNAGSASACGRKGYLLFKGIGTKKNVKKGRELLKNNALLGDAASQFYCYQIIREANNPKYVSTAKNLLADSARKNYEPAVFALNVNILNSAGHSEKEKASSVLSLKQLADSGYTDAQIYLARYFAFNKSSMTEIDDAKVYLFKAILKGRADAMLTLGDIYRSESTIKGRKNRANLWFELACHNGNKEACIEVKRKSTELSVSF